MTRAEHAREAEQLLARAHAQFRASQRSATQARTARDEAHWYVKAAGVHALLAGVDIELEVEQAAANAERPKPGPPIVMREVR